jgi:hypothetical protein
VLRCVVPEARVFFSLPFGYRHQKVPGSPSRTDFRPGIVAPSLASARAVVPTAEKVMQRRTRFICAASILTAAAAIAADYPQVAYPEAYRDWRHVKSMLIEEGHSLHASFGGLHHIYANDKALEGYRSGRFPDGAVIVFDLLEATRTPDHAVVEGARKVLGVMEKDAKRFSATGGWGFEGFKGDSHSDRAVAENAASACYACHTGQKERDYVFSSAR